MCTQKDWGQVGCGPAESQGRMGLASAGKRSLYVNPLKLSLGRKLQLLAFMHITYICVWTKEGFAISLFLILEQDEALPWHGFEALVLNMTMPWFPYLPTEGSNLPVIPVPKEVCWYLQAPLCMWNTQYICRQTYRKEQLNGSCNPETWLSFH